MNRLHYLQETIEQKKGARKQIATAIKQAQTEASHLRREIRRSEKVQAILQLVGNHTQKQLEYHISDMVNMGLGALFPHPYQLGIDFTSNNKGQTNCELSFSRDGITIPKVKSGGVRDFIALALRLALWALKRPRTRPLIIADEPFKHLSADLRPKVLEVFNELAAILKMQTILVVQDAEFMEGADRLYKFKLTNKLQTKVTIIEKD